MKSNKKFSIGDFKEKIKHFIFTEEGLKEIERYKQLPSEQKSTIKKKTLVRVSVCALAVIIFSFVIITSRPLFTGSNKNVQEQELTKQNEQNKDQSNEYEGKTMEITSQEQTKYMIDRLNNIYLKIAPTKLDDRVAYSVTYNYDIIPKGKVTYTHYFTEDYITTILLNGYPYVSYEKMGLKSEEEAYIATQLAIYELISREEIAEISNGMFSLDKIEASEEKYEDMVSRMVSKAKDLVKIALEETYTNGNQGLYDLGSMKTEVKDGNTIIGPFTTKAELDDITKKIMTEELKSVTRFNVQNIASDSKVEVIDENGNKVDEIETGKSFYLKIDTTDSYFVQLKFVITSKKLYTNIYSSDTSKKKYIIVEADNNTHSGIYVAYNNVDTAKLDIDFKNQKGEEITGTKYYIYDENGNLIQNITGFAGKNIHELPLGKYYVQQYSTDSIYLVNSNKYEVELNKKGETVKLEITNDSLSSLFK